MTPEINLAMPSIAPFSTGARLTPSSPLPAPVLSFSPGKMVLPAGLSPMNKTSPQLEYVFAKKRRSSSSGFSRWSAPVVLFLIGCFALGYWGYAILDAEAFQDQQSRRFDQALADANTRNAGANSAEAAPAVANRTPEEELRAEALTELSRRNPGAANGAGKSSETVSMPVFDGADSSFANAPPANTPLGRIEIASLGLSAMIQEGTGARTLQRGVGHITGTALVGHAGNVGLAGHRDTFFRKLRNIHEGDEITLTTLNGSFDYRVELISIVEPEDLNVLRNSGDNVLTLVTCYPFSYIGSAPKRFIVRAKQIPSSVSSSL